MTNKIKSIKRRIALVNVLVLLVITAVCVYDSLTFSNTTQIIKDSLACYALSLAFANWLMTAWYMKLYELTKQLRKERDIMYLTDFDEDIC